MNIRNLEDGITQLLNYNEKVLKKQRTELKKAPEGSLCVRRDKGCIRYCHRIGDKKTGISKNEKLVHALAKKKFLETSVDKLETNIKHLKKLARNYQTIEPVSIVEQMPDYCRNLPLEVYMPYERKKKKWMEEPFLQSTRFLEEKIHVTARDLWVRSKSEVIIAEKLDAYNIPYRYEQLIRIGKYELAPDFTILTNKGIIYWEHCGKGNDPNYVRTHNWKMEMYASAGIVPWKNLIVTYDMFEGDNEVGFFDSRIIDTEIVSKLI